MTQVPVLGVYSCQSDHCTGDGNNRFLYVLPSHGQTSAHSPNIPIYSLPP